MWNVIFTKKADLLLFIVSFREKIVHLHGKTETYYENNLTSLGRCKHYYWMSER